MTKNINLPDIGADAVEVTEILVAVGDQVVVEQALITVEGDKTSMEIPAPQAGRVTDIKVQVGEKIGTDHLIMLFEVDGSTATPALSKLDQGTFHVTAQASVSDSTERPSLKEALPIGQSDTSPREIMTEPPVSTTATGWANNPAYTHATPMVRRLAREFGIDLSQINGTGHKARVLKQDLQDFVKKVVTEQGNPDKGSSLALLPWPIVDFEQFGATERIALSRINKATGANLQRNAVVIPHVTQWETADITELEAFRKQQNQEAERQQLGFKLTPLVLIMKAVAKALQQMPRFNSSLSEDQQWLIVKKYIHLGVAVDTPNGLVVPVVRDVDQKGLMELSQELTDLSKKARAGKLSRTEMLGGCFTISSLGGIGGTAFTPIVNAPEVAILGVSRSNIQPQWDGKQFLPRLMLPLSLSYDHRVIDGADGARFITALSHLLSDIRRLLI